MDRSARLQTQPSRRPAPKISRGSSVFFTQLWLHIRQRSDGDRAHQRGPLQRGGIGDWRTPAPGRHRGGLKSGRRVPEDRGSEGGEPRNEEGGAGVSPVLLPEQQEGRCPRQALKPSVVLSLGELEPPASAALAVLLAFLHAAVAGEEAGLAKGGFQAPCRTWPGRGRGP